MSDASTAAIQTVVSVTSIVVAILAVVIAIRVEKRTAHRFTAEQALTQRLAIANIKPILSVTITQFEDLRGVNLWNHGTGTAVINAVAFSRNGQPVRNLVKLFEFQHRVVWDDFWAFGTGVYYVRPGEKITVVKLSLGKFLTPQYGPAIAAEILESFKNQLPGITLSFSYQDVLGSEPLHYTRTL